MADNPTRIGVSADTRIGETPGRRASEPPTPLMRQYQELKSRHPGEILLFRLGDFYEMFDDDARRAAPLLEVVLTQRQGTPMCGVPAHSVEPYVAKLLKAGLRVAMADQMEDPAVARGIVKRDVVRIMTAGTLQEETLLPSKRCNFLAALSPGETAMGLAALECSTGEFIATELSGPAAESQAWDELMRLGPSEVILEASAASDAWRERLKNSGIAVADLPASDFSGALAGERLKTLFGTASLRGFGLEQKPQALSAAGAVARYLENTQCGRPAPVRPLRTYELTDSLQMDANTIEHLELLPQTSAPPGRARSLLEVIDRTLTPMGGRLLRRWLVSPLRRVEAIRARQEKVAFFFERKEIRQPSRQILSGWPDFERIMARLSSGSAGPRDYAALGRGLARLPNIKSILNTSFPAVIHRHDRPNADRIADGPCLLPETGSGGGGESTNALQNNNGSPTETLGDDRHFSNFPEEPDLAVLLTKAIVEAPPAALKEGGVIREGYDPELDEVRSWIREGKTRLLELETREREQTGIPSLKVGFNNIFGYYIEVTKVNLAKVPAHYNRKQTTAGGERYITPELKDFESRILGAEERALRLESALLQEIRDEILKKSFQVQEIAQAVGELDVFTSLAEVAERRRYVKPVVDDSDVLFIREGRHPVLDELLPPGRLVPNDVRLDGSDQAVIILTGPNMSGKSTYLRQTALITILAQMGSYVPAEEARIGVIDQLFTRIGASDRLAEGESTFMVEMVETARILNHATPKSLVILDEVGRGTSTYDGISIAWACLEYLRQKGPKVLFATHYFEITQLAQTLPGVVNAHVTARDWGDHVVFLYTVEPGPADRSFGIHVAKLAGVPKQVLERATNILHELEKGTMKRDPKDRVEQSELF